MSDRASGGRRVSIDARLGARTAVLGARAFVLGAAAALLVACGDGASGPSLPGPAAKLTVSSGDDQAALAGTSLLLPVRVKVADAKGKARPGDTVTFAVAKGGGTLTGTLRVVTDATGNAVAPLWTLGKNGGTQQLTATSGTLSTRSTRASRRRTRSISATRGRRPPASSPTPSAPRWTVSPR